MLPGRAFYPQRKSCTPYLRGTLTPWPAAAHAGTRKHKPVPAVGKRADASETQMQLQSSTQPPAHTQKAGQPLWTVRAQQMMPKASAAAAAVMLASCLLPHAAQAAAIAADDQGSSLVKSTLIQDGTHVLRWSCAAYHSYGLRTVPHPPALHTCAMTPVTPSLQRPSALSCTLTSTCLP